MVIKIQPPAKNIFNAVNYNARKTEPGAEGEMPETGEVLAIRNVPEGRELKEEFQRLIDKNERETTGRKMTKPTFHMSVNPGKDDRPLTKDEVVSFIDEIMTRLGYGECPYAIYMHNDIARIHYHVVGCRIGQDGKKINDSMEERRLMKIANELSNKYGFTIGLDKNQGKKSEVNTETPSKNENKGVFGCFRIDSDIPFTQQYKMALNEAGKWHFSTPEQFEAIMRYRFRIDAEEIESGYLFSGLNEDNEKATTPVSEQELGLRTRMDVCHKCAEENMKKYRSQRKRVEDNAKEAMEKSKSYKDFLLKMAKKGIIVVMSWNKDKEAFGVTYLDRATKCAFKGSETGTDFQWLKNETDKRGWKIEPLKSEPYKPQPKITVSKPSQSIIQELSYKMRGMVDRESHGSREKAIDESELDLNPNDIKI